MQTVDESPAMPMPQYQCHKKVWALKVEKFETNFDSEAGPPVCLHFEDKRYAPREVDVELWERNAGICCAGWYFVVYEDGYESTSPPEAFESGYTLIG